MNVASSLFVLLSLHGRCIAGKTNFPSCPFFTAVLQRPFKTLINLLTSIGYDNDTRRAPSINGFSLALSCVMTSSSAPKDLSRWTHNSGIAPQQGGDYVRPGARENITKRWLLYSGFPLAVKAYIEISHFSSIHLGFQSVGVF